MLSSRCALPDSLPAYFLMFGAGGAPGHAHGRGHARGHDPKIHKASQIGIDRRLVSSGAIRTVEGLQQAGYKAFVVGGAVRDLMLGLRPKDFDVATDATPEDVQHIFRRARMIGKRFRLVHVLFGPETIEVSTFRAAAGEALDKLWFGNRMSADETDSDASDAKP